MSRISEKLFKLILSWVTIKTAKGQPLATGLFLSWFKGHFSRSGTNSSDTIFPTLIKKFLAFSQSTNYP
jgi:hypothetical protein